MVTSGEYLPSSFKVRTCVLLSFIYLAAIINTLFLLFANVVYKGEDNRINSLFGLLFIFTPFLCAIVLLIAIFLQVFIKDTEQESRVKNALGMLYMLSLFSSAVQCCIVWNYAGTSKKDDSAYRGLMNREIC
eukprot:TRINITY_DN7683_c0_g1_i3.p1 TRINITY_DN7683_c0_g1~~TRINITY_DN7683_c0_g1_i3.p1  ORF type:complete len:132 (+),score=26.51 TRINITY_DN7683_c0_g1_i3:195-590(+)